MRLPRWFKPANARRHALIDKKLAGTIAPSEAEELKAIDERMDEWEENLPSTKAMWALLEKREREVARLSAAAELLDKAHAAKAPAEQG